MTISDAIQTAASWCKRLVPGPGREWLRRQVLQATARLGARRFLLGTESFPYFFHDYNKAWACERTVEVPVALRLLERFRGRRILEVGNVLSHYVPVSHEVVDKYEAAPGVRNLDVVEVEPGPRYDLILSISTLEHVGWDEPVKDPVKILVALARLRACLAPGGLLMVTLPLNYNPEMDARLRSGEITFNVEHYLQRSSALNGWVETSRDTALIRQYGRPYVGANGLLIAYAHG